MDDYRCDLRLDAPVNRVFDAVATISGLRTWWIGDAPASTGEHHDTRIEWAPGSWTTMRLDRLVPAGEVEWRVADQHDVNLPRPDEWVGTSLRFVLEGEGGRTRLTFTHRGLAPALECHGMCASGWDHFLRRSLRQLLTAGAGAPVTAG